MVLASALVVFAQDDVEHRVQAVFDAPNARV
jgi:hypothetical protein